MSEYYDDSIYEAVGTGEDSQEETHRDIPADMPPVDQPKKPHKKNGGKKGVALALVCALLGGGMGVGGGFLGASLARGNLPQTIVSGDGVSTVMQGVRETSVLQIQQIDSSKELTAAEVYAANVNSTVGIVTSAVTTNFWGQQTQSAAAGSGFIFTDDGYIITNYHVIEGANTVTVSTYDGTQYDAKIIGYDESNDVAVLKVEAEGLTPVVIGSSSKLNVGDNVVAIGNPLGELTFSLTAGAVSALNRDVTMSSGSTQELIQTDCAINSGNSGGALFNMYGEVVGITNAKYSGSSVSGASIDNIGFAIPIDQVRSIFESIITNGYIVKPYIGVTVSDVSSESQSYGLPQGAAVRSVTENGPAAEAGLQENDIITAVNGETITGSNDLVKLVKASAAGDTLELTVYRQGQTTTLTLTVGEQKTDALPAQNTDQNQQSQQGYYDGGQSGQSDNQFGGSWPFGFGFGG